MILSIECESLTMPILNYTTKIDPLKTITEIQVILAKAGARTINIDFDDTGQPQAVSFMVNVMDNWLNFRLPSNHAGVWNVLSDDPAVPRAMKTEEQARRVAWRITKDWVAAQMAIIDARQAELAEVFLPYAVMPTGKTLFQEMKSGNFLLGSGSK
jgi:hypothetical protein